MTSPTKVGREATPEGVPTTVVVVGASSGIGRATCELLLARGCAVVGLARRDAALAHANYRHVIADVRAADYRAILDALGTPDVVIYASGIGEVADVTQLAHEADTFATNLLGAVITAEVFVPRMIAAKRGQLIGISSLADRMIDADAPAYAASKAGLSQYLEGLGLACRPHGVAITNLRFGFVDTAMAKSEVRPFLITAEQAARVIERCIATRPLRRSVPLRMAAVVWLLRWVNRFRVWIS